MPRHDASSAKVESSWRAKQWRKHALFTDLFTISNPSSDKVRITTLCTAGLSIRL